MKTPYIDTHFAFAILVLVASVIGFVFWLDYEQEKMTTLTDSVAAPSQETASVKNSDPDLTEAFLAFIQKERPQDLERYAENPLTITTTASNDTALAGSVTTADQQSPFLAVKRDRAWELVFVGQIPPCELILEHTALIDLVPACTEETESVEKTQEVVRENSTAAPEKNVTPITAPATTTLRWQITDRKKKKYDDDDWGFRVYDDDDFDEHVRDIEKKSCKNMRENLGARHCSYTSKFKPKDSAAKIEAVALTRCPLPCAAGEICVLWAGESNDDRIRYETVTLECR